MQRARVFIPDIGVHGEILSPGYAMSLIGYNDLGVRYEIYMDNNDFIEVEEEVDDYGM